MSIVSRRFLLKFNLGKMGEKYKTRGAVLYSHKYQERKLIVTMLTPDRGRCNFITTVGNGKGAVPRAMFQPFSLLEFEGEVSMDKLHKFSDVRFSTTLATIGVQPIKSVIAIMLCEVLYRVAKDCDRSFYDFVERMILALDGLDTSTQSMEIANFHLHFMVHLAVQLGYAPYHRCEPGQFFDIASGDFVTNKPSGKLYFELEQSKLLSDILLLGSDATCSFPLNKEQRRVFLRSMISYFRYHTEAIHRVRSIDILNDIF